MIKKLTTSTNDVLDTDLINVDESRIEMDGTIYVNGDLGVDGNLDVMGSLLINGYQLFNDTIQRIDTNGDYTLHISDDVKIKQYAVYGTTGILHLTFDRPVMVICTKQQLIDTMSTGFGVSYNNALLDILLSQSNSGVGIVYCFGTVFITSLIDEI